MTLSAGSRLGPYEILSPLGAGGMGEVYRARVHPGRSRRCRQGAARASDDNDKVIVRRRVSVDTFGAVSASVTIPATGALGYYRLMNDVGVLKDKGDYVEMAQLAIDAGVPGEAQHIVEAGVQNGTLKGADKTEQGRFDRLLASAKKQASADQGSLPQLAKEAQAATKGQAQVALGQAYLSCGKYDEAVAALQEGIKKGGVTDADEAQISLGIAQLSKCEYQAVHDGLTSLYTHKFFKEHLLSEIKRSERYKRPVALIMCDVDFFKKFNDTYGHLVGDEILKSVSQIISENVRSTDLVARYGGEEFAILLIEAGHRPAKETDTATELGEAAATSIDVLVPETLNFIQRVLEG